eukprot:TRINITY_DN12168_c0_g1_i2.p1 TRINITY_DN12168_c0_g1~~TRINITY_DN12168_c0_g1_i2.p1  ORF type:complete len:106 (-),score=6.84 TRINITY_DN12168_c0_g1_i2:45-362(-)
MVKWILPYLKGIQHMSLCFCNADLRVIECIDVDYASCRDIRRSTTRCIFTLSGGVVSWMSHLQSTVALSITKAEHVALIEAAKETTWLHGLVGWFGLTDQISHAL